MIFPLLYTSSLSSFPFLHFITFFLCLSFYLLLSFICLFNFMFFIFLFLFSFLYNPPFLLYCITNRLFNIFITLFIFIQFIYNYISIKHIIILHIYLHINPLRNFSINSFIYKKHIMILSYIYFWSRCPKHQSHLKNFFFIIFYNFYYISIFLC